jgi:hypothetical protein
MAGDLPNTCNGFNDAGFMRYAPDVAFTSEFNSTCAITWPVQVDMFTGEQDRCTVDQEPEGRGHPKRRHGSSSLDHREGHH